MILLSSCIINGKKKLFLGSFQIILGNFFVAEINYACGVKK